MAKRSWGSWLGALLAALACRTPAPDLDGTAGGAGRLELGSSRPDELDCGVGDCQDWFVLRVTAEGTARLEVRAADTAPAFELVASGGGRELRRAAGRGSQPVRIEWPAAPGEYQVALVAEVPPRPSFFARLFGAPRPAPWSYTLTSGFVPRPPAGPKFSVLRSEVLEIEGTGEILIDAGAAKGVKPGDRGVLLEKGREIGRLEIVAVYADGSRARLRGVRPDQIRPAMRVEIRIPVGR